jgi:hypothetical protein
MEFLLLPRAPGTALERGDRTKEGKIGDPVRDSRIEAELPFATRPIALV